ncbi:unnamed protein product [Rhizoctonia solani]|uniref:Uncharacterized protein n=1 Tax=Rhizoctonia solani TaxID=456999 RepID=A0A8H3BQA5_9AGAM|nr:unnamed protein product [Rhizoctonia solani]
MTDQQKPKRRKVVPPMAPRVQASKLSSATRGSARSLPNVGDKHTPSSGKYVLARPAYPTPESADRKGTPRPQPSKSHSNRGFSLDFEASSAPQTGIQSVINLDSSDSDDAVIAEYESPKRKVPKCKKSLTILRPDSEEGDSEEGEPKAERGKGKGKAPLEFGSDSDAVGSEDSGLDKEESGEEESGEEESDSAGGHPKRKTSTLSLSRSATPKASSSTTKSGGKIKTEDGVQVPTKKKQDVVQAFDNQVVRAHVLKSVLAACKLDRAQDAFKMVPLYDEAERPVHFADDALVIHFKRDFADEWESWGGRLLKILRDPSRMSAGDAPTLLALTDNDYRTVVKTGVYATMKTTWMKYESGEGEAWSTGRRDSRKQWGRKNQKATNRMLALQASRLDVGSFGFVADQNFVSSEDDDPKVKSGRIVRVPGFRSDNVNKLVGSLDVAFNSNKRRTGNQKCTSRKYVKVNMEVPKLKMGDPPRWAISKEWEDANPKLAEKSRARINLAQTVMPEADKVEQFFYRNVAEERTYEVVSVGASMSAIALTSAIPPAPIPSESEPVVDTVGEAMPAAEPLSIASAAESHALATGPAISHPPNPNIGVEPSFPAGTYPQPAPVPQPTHYAPNSMGQSIRIQLITGEYVWVFPTHPLPGNQPPAPNDLGNGNARADFEIDPAILGTETHVPNNMPPPPELNKPANESSEAAQYYAPNNMPPPPLLTEPADEPSDATVLPSKSRTRKKDGGGEGRGGGRGGRGGRRSKSKADAEDKDGGPAGEAPVAGPSKRGGKGSRGGGRGGRGGRRAKSKAIIEDAEDEDEDEEPAEEMPIAGPSNQQPGNSKTPRIRCKVRGE